jgi:hypothetical protein
MKSKVYFAKSNACCPKTVASVRSYLQNLDVELVEHAKNQSYSNTALLGCEYLVVLPERPDAHTTVIGRGLYSQIEDFHKKNRSSSKIMIISEIPKIKSSGYNYDPRYSLADISVCSFDEIEVIDTTDWSNYAQLSLNPYTEISVAQSLTKQIRKIYIKTKHSLNDADIDGTSIEYQGNSNLGAYGKNFYLISTSNDNINIPKFLNDNTEISGLKKIGMADYEIVEEKDVKDALKRVDTDPVFPISSIASTKVVSFGMPNVNSDTLSDLDNIFKETSIQNSSRRIVSLDDVANELIKKSEEIIYLPKEYLLIVG